MWREYEKEYFPPEKPKEPPKEQPPPGNEDLIAECCIKKTEYKVECGQWQRGEKTFMDLNVPCYCPGDSCFHPTGTMRCFGHYSWQFRSCTEFLATTYERRQIEKCFGVPCPPNTNEEYTYTDTTDPTIFVICDPCNCK